MDGFSNIVFKGDKIVWHNLFKYYVMCLERRCNIYILCKEWCEQPFFNLNYMVINNAFDDLYSKMSKKIFDDIYQDFKKDCSKEIDIIATRETPITKYELYYYLSAIHFIALAHINEHYVKNGFSRNYGVDYFEIEKVYKDSIVSFVECWSKYNVYNEQYMYEKFDEINERCNHIKFACDMEANKNFLNLPLKYQMTMYDFPNSYIEYLNELVYPKYYVSCFLKECNNSSIWTHYADEHRGACLIFKQFNKTIQLKPNNYDAYISFRKINYDAKFEFINFFENIGNLTEFQISNWYLGENDKKSPIIGKILSNKEKMAHNISKKVH